MKNVINIDKFKENKINTYYEEYLSNFYDRKRFYNIVMENINEEISKGKTSISVYIDRRLYYDKIFELLETEFKEMNIILRKERNCYSFYIDKCETLKKINDFYIELQKKETISKEQFIKERQFLFE